MPLSLDIHAPFSEPEPPVALAFAADSVQASSAVPIPKKLLFDVLAESMDLVPMGVSLGDCEHGMFSAAINVVQRRSILFEQFPELVFHGDSMFTVNDAVESAYAAGIKELKRGADVVLNDDNYPELVRTRRDLSTATIWGTMLDQKCRRYQASAQEAAAKQARYRDQLIELCKTHEAVLSVGVSNVAVLEQQAGLPCTSTTVQYTGPPVPVTELERLSSSIIGIIEDLSAPA